MIILLQYIFFIIGASTQVKVVWEDNLCNDKFNSPERLAYLESKFNKNIDGGLRRPKAWKGDIK